MRNGKQFRKLGQKVTNKKLIHSSPTFLAVLWHTLDPHACTQELLSAEVHKKNMLSPAQTPAKECAIKSNDDITI